MKTLVLIDTSYTIFYRYYATIKWYSLAYKDEYKDIKNNIDYNWYNNNIFIEKYEKMFLESIIKLIKKKIIYSKDTNIIFCLDSPKEHLWRTKIQCDYKSNRILKIGDDNNIKFFFNYTYTNILPNIINKYNNFCQLQISNIEADDIIGIICLYIKKYKFNYKIYLISSDNDFYQLGFDNLYFINYKTKKELLLNEEEALNELNKKIIFGDKSDCIPSILKKRVNNKYKLLDNDILVKYLNENPESKLQYDINKKMIDFNYIPKEYYDKVINNLKQYNLLS
jgi:5'-3' exonuclease